MKRSSVTKRVFVRENKIFAEETNNNALVHILLINLGNSKYRSSDESKYLNKTQQRIEQKVYTKSIKFTNKEKQNYYDKPNIK